ncbi:hypothetical protein DsansV1_C01g0009721 [Dioscorea sansibarensis]
MGMTNIPGHVVVPRPCQGQTPNFPVTPFHKTIARTSRCELLYINIVQDYL